MRHFLLVAILVISFPDAWGQNPEDIFGTLGEYLRSANHAYRFNGVALVLRNGKVLLNKGYGFSQMDTKALNTPETRFPILSLTKTITATVILKLSEEGKLSVDDKLTKYFPDYPNGSKISIHHLLTHSSGIYNYTGDVGVEDSAIVNHPISKEKVLNYFKDKPLDFSPGKYYSYNNSGYFLLGLIIEKVTGKPYETIVKDYVFRPLGMNQSGFDFINLPKSVKAQGYEIWNKDSVVPYKHYDSTFAYSAGSVYSTTNDLMKWANAVSSRQILTAKTWELAFRPKIKNYGYGWMSGEFIGKKYVRHSGGYPGFMSEFIYFPDDGITVVLLNNFGDYDMSIWPVGMGISCIVYGQPYDNWRVRNEVKVDKSILQKHIGRYRNGKSTIEVKLRDNKLYALIAGLPEFELHAESDNDYFFRDFNTSFHFDNDLMTVHEHGQDSHWVRKD
jgi:CubicO group peptidase (beta-lactamase class C family)